VNGIKEWWAILDAKHQKIYVLVAALVLIFIVFSVVPKAEKRERAEGPAEVEVDLLNGDLGEADMNKVFAKFDVLEKENSTLRKQIGSIQKRQQQQQNALSAATQIADNPEQLGNLFDEINRMKEDLQEISENGVVRSDSVLAPPVQLVLGGESNTPDVQLQTDEGVTATTNPFSDVDDQDAINPITSYDPLSAIKSSIEESTKPQVNESGAFSFAKDKSFERPLRKTTR